VNNHQLIGNARDRKTSCIQIAYGAQSQGCRLTKSIHGQWLRQHLKSNMVGVV